MRIRPTLTLAAAGTLGLLIATSALAQGLYRHVDAKGRVTYSDQPPAGNAGNAVNASSVGRAGASASASPSANTAALPYTLRQVVQRYPATLYSGEDCGACAEARTLLQTRGIPFEERTVKTSQDIDAFEQLSGQNSIPLLTLGSQQLKGFSESQWSQYLDAAGYPRSTQLPPGYRNPPAQPLVAVKTDAPAQAASAPDAAANTPAERTPAPIPAPAPTAGSPSNPAGIRF